MVWAAVTAAAVWVVGRRVELGPAWLLGAVVVGADGAAVVAGGALIVAATHRSPRVGAWLRLALAAGLAVGLWAAPSQVRGPATGAAAAAAATLVAWSHQAASRGRRGWYGDIPVRGTTATRATTPPGGGANAAG